MVRRHRKLKRSTGALPRDKGRIGKIYTAGVRPAVSFGDAVTGCTDAELKKDQVGYAVFLFARSRESVGPGEDCAAR
eukprot:7525921-Pyramimonas_sp.AAC.1